MEKVDSRIGKIALEVLTDTIDNIYAGAGVVTEVIGIKTGKSQKPKAKSHCEDA